MPQIDSEPLCSYPRSKSIESRELMSEQQLPVRGFRAKYLNLFRIATYILIVVAIGHTWGALLSIPGLGPDGDRVLAAMKSVHFRCLTRDCTWYSYYYGFGMMLSVFLLLSAAITWFIGGLGDREQRALAPITWALFLSYVATSFLAWRYLFPPPAIFSVVIAALLGVQSFRSVR